MHAKWFQLCPTPCNPVDRSPPDCSDQARILEWVAFPSPGDLPNPGIEPGSLTFQADSLPSEPPGKPITTVRGSKMKFITPKEVQTDHVNNFKII